MKYVVSWETRENASEELQARGLQIFSKWSPDENADFQQFVTRVDGRGGFAVVETDDVTLIARDMALFAPFFAFSVHPVLEVMEGAGIAADAVATRESIT
ncbi:MAG: DUF3303 family protein [Nitriliruptorales bacterium]|nr:DUF3303 family protein [Nitriliruptorales bacterium]